ncbi:MAG: proline--tRNA ligase [Alphaproteobacteria bacterium]|jgi:prolyl-tRNA synthetase|nr:proline--tRNA ligase [Alphaproteobacteria bacterium]
MLYSKYFAPTQKEAPKDASIVSHSLMLKCGLIRQTYSGIYIWLPLGLKVLDKISQIIKNEMNKSGAINVLMPTIQSSDIWVESGRYDDYGLEMLRIKDRHGKELLYGPTNEEQITQVVRDNVKSYKDFPMNLYQIQWKFRDEIRPRFGVMRGREFLMKDAYSFDMNEEGAVVSYKKMFATYLKIFDTLGLKAIPMQADTGPIGGELSHEFMILAKTGESEVFCDKSILDLSFSNKEINYDNDIEDIFKLYTSFYAATDEKHDINDTRYTTNKDNVVNMRGIEVGHIFSFGDKYSKSMRLEILDSNGKLVNPQMGSYGIGVSRLVGAIIEANHDDKGIIWHKSVAPFLVMLSNMGNQENVVNECNNLYKILLENNIDVLYNNKDESAGSKLATADMLGFPYQINIGNKSLADGKLELKNRLTGEVIMMDIKDTSKLISILKS